MKTTIHEATKDGKHYQLYITQYYFAGTVKAFKRYVLLIDGEQHGKQLGRLTKELKDLFKL